MDVIAPAQWLHRAEQKPQMATELDIDTFFEKARNHLAALNEAHRLTWKLGAADRWDANQETGIICWTFPDGVVVRAPFQIVGTYNTRDGTFLWGWDLPSVAKQLQEDAKAVLAFAHEHDVDFLQDQKLGCDEDAAWDLAALTILVCDRQGAYRDPAGMTYVYMTFGEVTISNE